MSYLAKWVSEVMKEGHTITAADVEVLARVQQALLASDKHHQQARAAQRDAQANVVSAAVALAEVWNDYNHLRNSSGNYAKRQTEMYKVLVDEAHEDLRAAVVNLLAVEAAS